MEEALKLDIKDYLDSKNIQSFHIDSLCSVTKLKEKTRMLSNKYGESFKEVIMSLSYSSFTSAIFFTILNVCIIQSAHPNFTTCCEIHRIHGIEFLLSGDVRG